MLDENPYAPPVLCEQSQPTEEMANILNAQRKMQWLSCYLIFFHLLNIAFISALTIKSYVLTPESVEEILIEDVVLVSFLILSAIFGIFCAFQIRQLKHIELGQFCMIWMLLPCSGILCIVQAPFALWGLYLLSSPEIKAAFFAVKQRELLLKNENSL